MTERHIKQNDSRPTPTLDLGRSEGMTAVRFQAQRDGEVVYEETIPRERWYPSVRTNWRPDTSEAGACFLASFEVEDGDGLIHVTSTNVTVVE